MGTKIRVEVGDRVVEVVAETRAEALKAFKFAIRGLFPVDADLTVRWHVRKFPASDHPQLTDESGNELPRKIGAIKAFREATGYGLADAKQAIESGYWPAKSADDARSMREALRSYVCFVA